MVSECGGVAMGVGVEKGQKTKSRTVCVFNYFHDDAVEREITERIKTHLDYVDTVIEFHSFTHIAQCSNRAVGSFVFVLSIFLLFLEGKFPIEEVKEHMVTRYGIMSKTILARLASYSEKEWAAKKIT